MPPVQGQPGRPKPPRRTVARRRALAALGLVAAVGLVVAVALFAVDRGDTAKPATTAVAPPLRIVFPEGFTRREMAARITAVRRIAETKRGVTPTMTAPGYLAATARSKLPGVFARDGRARSLEGFLFPATYDFVAATTSRQLVQEQLQAFRENWAKVNLRYARSKNLTPYDVLIIASMIEKEALAPEERALVAAVIYNRLHARMPLGIDATLRYGLHIPPTQAIRAVAAPERQRVQHAPPPRAPADADRQPGPRRDPGGRASGEGRLPLLRAQAGQAASLLHRELREVPRLREGARVWRLNCGSSALLGKPVSHSLSPRMQNAAFAAAGLPWRYEALEVEPEGLEAAVRELDVRRQRDDPVQGRRVRSLHGGRRRGAPRGLGQHARRPRRRDPRLEHGRARGHGRARRRVSGAQALVLGAGGAARAVVAALEAAGAEVSIASRSGEWPPDASGADVIVNATPVKDELLVEPRRGSGGRRSRVQRRRLRHRARRGRAPRGLPDRRRRARDPGQAGSGVVRALDGAGRADRRDAGRHPLVVRSRIQGRRARSLRGGLRSSPRTADGGGLRLRRSPPNPWYGGRCVPTEVGFGRGAEAGNRGRVARPCARRDRDRAPGRARARPRRDRRRPAPAPAGVRPQPAPEARDGRGRGARRAPAGAHARHPARARRPKPRPQELDVGDEPVAAGGRARGQGGEAGHAAAARSRRPARGAQVRARRRPRRARAGERPPHRRPRRGRRRREGAARVDRDRGRGRRARGRRRARRGRDPRRDRRGARRPRHARRDRRGARDRRPARARLLRGEGRPARRAARRGARRDPGGQGRRGRRRLRARAACAAREAHDEIRAPGCAATRTAPAGSRPGSRTARRSSSAPR